VQAQLRKRKLSAAPIADMHVTWTVAASPRRSLSRQAQALVQMLRESTRGCIASGDWLSAELLS
jgi:hypothetical protein